MNTIFLKGKLRDIQPSHKIGDIEYNKANLIVPRFDGKEDIISLRYKKFSNTMYNNGDTISITGNVRSYSHQLENGKNKYELYVFTYFDPQENISEDINNEVEIDGKICKIDPIRVTKNGKQNIHFILANNINLDNGRINSYIPCVAWGKNAIQLKDAVVGDYLHFKAQLHSREYVKKLSDTESEIKVAHELVLIEIKGEL